MNRTEGYRQIKNKLPKIHLGCIKSLFSGTFNGWELIEKEPCSLGTCLSGIFRRLLDGKTYRIVDGPNPQCHDDLAYVEEVAKREIAKDIWVPVTNE
jgi:hypothetical protein